MRFDRNEEISRLKVIYSLLKGAGQDCGGPGVCSRNTGHKAGIHLQWHASPLLGTMDIIDIYAKLQLRLANPSPGNVFWKTEIRRKQGGYTQKHNTVKNQILELKTGLQRSLSRRIFS